MTTPGTQPDAGAVGRPDDGTDGRPDDLPKELLDLGTATLGESGAVPLPPSLRPVWRGAALAGPAQCASCAPGDNLAIHVAVSEAAPGSVIVASVGDEHELGYWGEVLATAAQARGVAGLVIDGCTRDTDALMHLRFPVFSRGTALRGATKERPGTVGAPVVVAGVAVARGDWVVADVDGVVVLPADRVGDIFAAARARFLREVELFEQLRRGATTLELLGLDASLVERRP